VTKKKRARRIGESIGGILVGFDQQILRDLPPAHELVQKSTPQRGLSGKDDGLEVVFPDDEPAVDRQGSEDRDTAV
jgi:hypothetical protein